MKQKRNLREEGHYSYKTQTACPVCEVKCDIRDIGTDVIDGKEVTACFWCRKELDKHNLHWCVCCQKMQSWGHKHIWETQGG